MLRDSAIKKLLKIFLFLFSIYIFTIKIFLKNIYYALIHKKRKKKASFGFSGHIQGQFQPFPACFDCFPACFGCIGHRSIRPDMVDTARFWPNQPSSAQIKADSVRIKPHRRESSQVGANPRKKKKKNRRRSPTCGQLHRTRVRRPCFIASNPPPKPTRSNHHRRPTRSAMHCHQNSIVKEGPESWKRR